MYKAFKNPLLLRTGGASSFVPDSTGPDYLNNALTSCFQYQPSTPSKEKQEISYQNTYSNIKSLDETFTIDQFCGRQVKIELDYQNVAGTFTVNSNLDASITGNMQGTGALDFTIDVVTAGEYTISLNPSSGQASIEYLTLLVKCKAQEDTEPILSKCWTSAGQEDLNIQGNEPDKLIIYGQVTQGANPVLNAAITAEISDEKGAVTTLLLKDDGLSPDTINNDGIYSGFYIPSGFTEAGSRYSLSCKISGNNETTFVNTTSTKKNDDLLKSFPSKPTSTTPMCCGSQGIKVMIQIRCFLIFFLRKIYHSYQLDSSPGQNLEESSL